jgi:hypothetical protein
MDGDHDGLETPGQGIERDRTSSAPWLKPGGFDAVAMFRAGIKELDGDRAA